MPVLRYVQRRLSIEQSQKAVHVSEVEEVVNLGGALDVLVHRLTQVETFRVAGPPSDP
jgi:hypothetical protein